MPHSCQVTGDIKGLSNRPVLFFYQQGGKQHRDTVRAVNDRFTYALRPSDDGVIYLKIIPSHDNTLLWYEPGQLMITGTAAIPGQLAVRGTPDNEVSTQYHEQIGWKFDQRRRARPDSSLALRKLSQRATLAFVRAHPQARTSADLLYGQIVYDGQPLAEYEQLLRGLSPAVRASTQGRAVAKRLVLLRDQPVVGRPAPAFTVPDTAGVPVPLSRFRGQYVLLDFWGHWCGPCITSMPHLRQLQAQYAQRLAVVGVGMEQAEDKPLWQQAIRKYQANWTQLSDLNGTEGVIAQYNVTAFPTYLLLDPQGVVVAQGGELGPIEAKLKMLVPAP